MKSMYVIVVVFVLFCAGCGASVQIQTAPVVETASVVTPTITAPAMIDGVSVTPAPITVIGAFSINEASEQAASIWYAGLTCARSMHGDRDSWTCR